LHTYILHVSNTALTANTSIHLYISLITLIAHLRRRAAVLVLFYDLQPQQIETFKMTHITRDDPKTNTPPHNYRWRRKLTHNAQSNKSFTATRRSRLLHSALILMSVVSWATAFSVSSKTYQRHSLQPATNYHSNCFCHLPFRAQPFKPRLVRGACVSALYSSKKTDDSSTTSSAASPDQQEWEAMLAAFKMYKAAYGNLNVPLRFVVPALPPWPG
jgi:hypothetical protein